MAKTDREFYEGLIQVMNDQISRFENDIVNAKSKISYFKRQRRKAAQYLKEIEKEGN